VLSIIIPVTDYQGGNGCLNHKFSRGLISVNDNKRPVNLDLTKFAFPVTSISSIAHRLAGVALFAGTALFLYGLHMSLASEASFNELVSLLGTIPGKLITLGLLSALAYHFIAGIKHYLMDMGVAEDLEGGIFAARSTLLYAAVVIVFIVSWVL